MQIIVKGTAKKSVTPNLVKLNIDVKEVDTNYNDVLTKGSSVVSSLVSDILIPNGFNSDDLLTSSFIVKEENNYNNALNKYEVIGYSYNQSLYIEFDYNSTILNNLINSFNEFKYSVNYSPLFKIKDEDIFRKELYTTAFNDAKNSADIIALANNQKLERCIKTSFEPIEDVIVSKSSFKFDELGINKMSLSDNSNMDLTGILNPVDINLEQELYCIWIAE